jgi:hypothetical protein
MLAGRSLCPLALVAAAIALAGCEDFSRYSTKPGEAYCGAVTLGSDFRAGLSPRVQMSLVLDASKLDGPGSPGTISTFELTDFAHDTGIKAFDEAPLRRIKAMEADPLSRLDFGDGRERSAIYAVSPADDAAAPMLAVLSLIHDGSVEVRLLRPGREGEVGGDDGEIFGLFSLFRRPGGCGF